MLFGPLSIRRLGIVFAMPIEECGLNKTLSQSYLLSYRDGNRSLWQVAGIELMVEISGIGRECCQRSTERLIADGASSIICAGFAAALTEEAVIGDVVLANRVFLRNYSDIQPIPCSKNLAPAMPRNGDVGYTIRKYDLITSDTVVTRASEKIDIRMSTGAGALDMESYEAARICNDRQIPFAAIRAITDTSEQSLPQQTEFLMRSESTIERIIFILTNPALWPHIFRLRRNSNIAANNLGDALGLVLLRFMHI